MIKYGALLIIPEEWSISVIDDKLSDNKIIKIRDKFSMLNLTDDKSILPEAGEGMHYTSINLKELILLWQEDRKGNKGILNG